MEVGRRGLDADNEFRERRRRRKKMGGLPLAMLLSFNDKDVHPECPNASNPYHKCDRYCLGKFPSGKNLLDIVRSDGDREWEKNSVKRGVDPNCNNASNPYHICAEYCFEKFSEKPQEAGKDQPGMSPKEEKKAVFTAKRGVKSVCQNASNPYHVCAEYCFQNVPEREQPGQVMRRDSKEGEKVLSNRERTGLHPHCKHASNPYHECTESCFQSVPDRNLAEGEKPRGVSNKTNKSSVHLKRNVSSPYDKVTEYCSEDTAKKEYPKGDMKPMKEKKIDVTTQQGFSFECKNASNPYHVCAEYCFQSVPEREQHGQVIRLKSSKKREKVLSNTVREERPKGVSLEIDKGCALPNRKHASNSFREVSEYCFDDTPKKEHRNGAMKPKEENIVSMTQRVNHDCENVSNPYHVSAEYCFQNLPVKDQRGEALMKSKEDKKVSVPLESVMNPQCKNASNPYHVCAEYCFENVPKGQHTVRAMRKSKEEKKAVASPQRVNSDCKNASNPYHVCAEYCLENVLERDQPRQTINKSKEEEMVVLPLEGGLNTDCKFASNPYHVCTEYCFQNSLEREQRGKVMKLKSSKEIKNSVSNKKITSGQAQCEHASNPYHECAEYCFNNNMPSNNISVGVMKTKERKKENSYALRRGVNPKCKDASNPFHRCDEYCSEGISPKNEAVEGITAAVKKKKRNSPKESKRNHPIKDKSVMSDERVEATKPSHNYVASSQRIILQDGIEKGIMDSKYAEALNQTNNNLDLNSGITIYMQDGSKDLQPAAKAVEMKNPKVPTDMQPLRTDASDLLHEWAKYCSQTQVAEDEIVGLGEVGRTKGKGNVFLKEYDAANKEKVQATGGLSRSLLISLLFFIRFLLALLYWAQVIYSLVISSEKNEGRERMTHKGHVNPKCRKVSDPYHKCSEYCFRGVGEEMQYI